ncbi:MAG: hypothetical protein ACK4FV_01820 [Candidatus Nitrosocaldus sp.]
MTVLILRPSDGVINLGQHILARATTTNPDVDTVKFTWIRPDSSIAREIERSRVME